MNHVDSSLVFAFAEFSRKTYLNNPVEKNADNRKYITRRHNVSERTVFKYRVKLSIEKGGFIFDCNFNGMEMYDIFRRSG